MRKKELRALLVGLGLDGADGHVRITRGENFRLFGGSEVTHGRMQETAVRFNEELQKRDRRLENLDRDEFIDIARSVDPSPPTEKDD